MSERRQRTERETAIACRGRLNNAADARLGQSLAGPMSAIDDDSVIDGARPFFFWAQIKAI